MGPGSKLSEELDVFRPNPTYLRPDIDQTKKANPFKLAFVLKIKDPPESDVERAMGIEQVGQVMKRKNYPLHSR